MTVSNATSRTTGTGTGAVVDFDFDFKVFATTDIQVYVDGILKTITTDYTVSLNTVTEGGTVTFTTAPANNAAILILRVLSFTQPSGLPTEGNFPEATLEAMVDKSRMLEQQLQEELNRAPKFSPSSSTSNVVFPEPDAAKYVGWSSSNTLENKAAPVSTDLVLPSNTGKDNYIVQVDESGDTFKYLEKITPTEIDAPASTTAAGIIEIATTAEALAGTDTTRAVTPEGVKTYADALVLGGMPLLGSVTASASASMDFTSMMSSTYDNYTLVLEGIRVATDDAFLYLRVSENNGSAWKSGASDYKWLRKVWVTGTIAATEDTADAQIPLSSVSATFGLSNAATEVGTFIVHINSVNSAAHYPSIISDGFYTPASGTNMLGIRVGGNYIGSTAAINAIQVLASTGNITSGTGYLYGRKKS